MAVDDWSEPLRIVGTDRPATVVRGPDKDGRRQVASDWFCDGKICKLIVEPDGATIVGRFEIENVPEPADQPDDDKLLRIAREAAARALDARQTWGYAGWIRKGNDDSHMCVQAALIALREGERLLESAEPQDVRDARKVIAEWESNQRGDQQ